MATCAAVVAAALLGTSATAVAAPAITEYGGLSGPSATGITGGPGLRVFFTELDNPGLLGRIDADGTGLMEWAGGSLPAFSKDRKPYDVTEGPDGALWATESGGTPGLVRFSAGGPTDQFTSGGLSGGARLAGIVTGPDGHLWATDQNKPATIVEYDPALRTFKHHPLPTTDAQPQDIAVGADGNLWFTEPGGTGRIGRITVDGTVTEFSAGLSPGASPWGITAGPDGALWFTERTDPGRIGRITTGGVITEYALAGVANPTGIAAGTDGALWFAAAGGDGAIGRITTAGDVTLHTAGLTAGRAPQWITRGPDGNIWFSETGGVARVTVAPGVADGSVDLVGETTAALRGAVRPNAQDTSFRIEYGPTTAYGSQTADIAVGNSTSPKTVTATLEGLSPGTTYHARIVATNGAGTTVGRDLAFTTTAVAQVPGGGTQPPASGDDLPAPFPEMGDIVVAAPVKGTVRWRTAHGRFAALGTTAGLPSGAIVDARRGRLALTSEIVGGKVQKAEFWGGMFQVHQSRTGDGTVRLVLRGTTCVRRKARSASADPTATAARKRKKRRHTRRLWGSDDHGR
jgi:virginiamycin B lyase